MPDLLAESAARLEKLLQQLRMDPFSRNNDELVAEIWKILAEREQLREAAATRPK